MFDVLHIQEELTLSVPPDSLHWPILSPGSHNSNAQTVLKGRNSHLPRREKKHKRKEQTQLAKIHFVPKLNIHYFKNILFKI